MRFMSQSIWGSARKSVHSSMEGSMFYTKEDPNDEKVDVL